MCKSFHQALRIEYLLRRVKDDVPRQATIRIKPYDCIEDVLDYLCASNPSKEEEIMYFERGYQALRGKSIDQLLLEGIDVDLMISELESIL